MLCASVWPALQMGHPASKSLLLFCPCPQGGGPAPKPWESQHLTRRGVFLLPLHQALGGGLASCGHLEVQRERWRGERVKGRGGWVRLCKSGCSLSATPLSRSCRKLAESAQLRKESCQMLSCFTTQGARGGDGL